MNKVPLDHQLIGTWITEDEDSDAAFTFSVTDDIFQVSGFSRSSAERFEISEINWNGMALSFLARLPSTGTTTKNVFRLRPDGRVDLELTLHEIWKKKGVKPGDLPEVWVSLPQGAS